jgi:hypothetical protein
MKDRNANGIDEIAFMLWGTKASCENRAFLANGK